MDSHSSTRPVRVRIAPSPTGDPHVGTAYIGLINLVFARQHGGQFIIRIEDTDQTRSTRAFEDAIFRSLRWFGLTWDEGPDIGGPHGPYRQSERTEIYQEHAQRLIDRGYAYRCFCTSERLEDLRARQRAEKANPGYDRHCRELSADDIQKNLDASLPYVVRLKMPVDGDSIIRDRLRGPVSFQNALIDDQVLLKSDGFPTYHLANVVDDHLMGITHVIRAEEWLSSTPKHTRLYEAFGWEAPEFIHMPLLRNKDRSKISKRKNPVSLVYYEQNGYLPEGLRNFLALMGWTPPDGREKFTLDEMIATFDIDRISLGGPVFDLEKLRWLNAQYVRELSAETLGTRLYASLFAPDYFQKIVPLVHERMEIFEDFWKYADFFFLPELNHDAKAIIPKGKTAAETRVMLTGILEKLEEGTRHGFTAPYIEQCLRSYCETSGHKIKDVFMAVRLTATGKAATPPLFETLEVLGKERIRRRFAAADLVLKAEAQALPAAKSAPAPKDAPKPAPTAAPADTGDATPKAQG